MTRTIVLVAHRAGARVFAHNTGQSNLELIKEIEHPQGHLQNHDINSDKPGRSLSSFQDRRHSLSNEQDPREHIAQVYVKDLGQQLEQMLTSQQSEKLVLVAEPKLLGLLREALPKSVRSKVVAEVGKDLLHVTQHELPRYLNEVLRFE